MDVFKRCTRRNRISFSLYNLNELLVDFFVDKTASLRNGNRAGHLKQETDELTDRKPNCNQLHTCGIL